MEEMGGPSIVTVRRDDSSRWTAQMDGYPRSSVLRRTTRTEPRLQANSPSPLEALGHRLLTTPGTATTTPSTASARRRSGAERCKRDSVGQHGCLICDKKYGLRRRNPDIVS